MTEPSRDPGEGTLERVGDRWQLRFVRRPPHSPEKVWRALSEEDHLAAWFPTTIEGELTEGAALRFEHRDVDAPPSTGEVIAYEAPRVLEFTWGLSDEEDDEAERPERVRFELAPEEQGCRLTFTTTYDRVGKSARDAAGWHLCFDLLGEHLAGDGSPAGSPERWKELNRRYTELFGPEAATVGPPESMEGYRE